MKPGVNPTATGRDIVIGIAVAAGVLAFIAFAITSMSSRVAGNDLTGTITAKHFKPQDEQQITIGRSGVREKEIDGQYSFEVEVGAEKKIYTVWVDKTVYDTRQVGEQFRFPRPAPPSR